MPRTAIVPRAREKAQLVLVAVVALVPFIGLGVWASQGAQALWERGLLDALLSPVGFVGTVSETINAIGNLIVWAVVIALAAGLLFILRGLRAASLVLLSFASDLAAFVVKVLVERDRPDTAAVEQFFGADNFSYPSGHTVRAAALVAAIVWLLAPARARLPLAVGAGLGVGIVMGYARVALGVHWPTDTIGGTLLGLAWFALSTLFVWFVVKPSPQVDRAEG